MRPAFSLSARHALFRPQRSVQKRFSSSSKRSETSKSNTQDALESVQKGADWVWTKAQSVLGPLGDKVGNLVGPMKDPIIYNFRVAGEVIKQVYITEGLHLPTRDSLRTAYSSLWSNASSAAYWRGAVSNGDIGRVGIYALEAYGIFKIGEIIGRGSLVGYKLH